MVIVDEPPLQQHKFFFQKEKNEKRISLKNTWHHFSSLQPELIQKKMKRSEVLINTIYSRINTNMFGVDPDRIGLLGKPPAAEIRSPPRASSRTRLLRSPHANAGMKRNECGRTKPLFRVGHDRGKNKRSKPKGLRQY
jgi:hypothetical protein